MAVCYFLSAFVLSAGFIHGYAASYKTYSSINKCDETIYLECPSPSFVSAGSITFRPYIHINTSRSYKADMYRYNYDVCEQPGPCRLTVKTRQDCGSAEDQYAIYLNFRTFRIPSQSRLEIYDTSTEPVLQRSWRGYGDDSDEDRYSRSVAQTRSDYARRPALSLEYLQLDANCRTARMVVFDYIIAESRRTENNTYCTALDGYINRDYICDNSGYRINCPVYLSDRIESKEPAYDRQYCLPSGWILGGITAASAVGLVLLIATALCLYRRCRRCSCTRFLSGRKIGNGAWSRKPFNWTSQRKCSFVTPCCNCAVNYDILFDTGSEDKLVIPKTEEAADDEQLLLKKEHCSDKIA